MTNQHPITPPFDLVKQWAEESPMELSEDSWAYELFIAHQAARWGADQELEACCEWLANEGYGTAPDRIRLVSARRPKPPSLKEQAQAELDRLIALIPTEGAMAMAEPIRKALEALPND